MSEFATVERTESNETACDVPLKNVNTTAESPPRTPAVTVAPEMRTPRAIGVCFTGTANDNSAEQAEITPLRLTASANLRQPLPIESPNDSLEDTLRYYKA